MKNLNTAFYQATLIIAVIIGASSCVNNDSKDTKDIAEEHNEAKFDKNSSEKDAQFLVNAAEINMEGVSLGQLAQQKGNMNQVKELGKMMEDSHTKLLADLTALAKTKNVSLPTLQTENGKEAYKNLSDKSDNNFDKSYADLMVNQHKDAIALFEEAAENSTDIDIKAWATATLPTLRIHLDHSIMCQKECEKM